MAVPCRRVEEPSEAVRREPPCRGAALKLCRKLARTGATPEPREVGRRGGSPLRVEAERLGRASCPVRPRALAAMRAAEAA